MLQPISLPRRGRKELLLFPNAKCEDLVNAILAEMMVHVCYRAVLVVDVADQCAFVAMDGLKRRGKQFASAMLSSEQCAHAQCLPEEDRWVALVQALRAVALSSRRKAVVCVTRAGECWANVATGLDCALLCRCEARTNYTRRRLDAKKGRPARGKTRKDSGKRRELWRGWCQERGPWQ